jgi:hypothetical protein
MADLNESGNSSDRKAELLKKKALLEDLKKRKHEREQLKLSQLSTTSTLVTAFDGLKSDIESNGLQGSSSLLSQFNDLNADEILSRIGISSSQFDLNNASVQINTQNSHISRPAFSKEALEMTRKKM